MRVAGIEQFEDAVGMLEIADPRALREDEVLIDVHAAGVGAWDEYARLGNWDLGRKPPMALGVEAAGVVAAVGPAVDGWTEGDEVLTHPLPLADQGAWAPQLIASAEFVVHKPPGVPWPVAAAFPVPALTAVQVLEQLELRTGETLLVNGGGGTTGGLIVALAALRGVRVLATGGPNSRDRLIREGASEVVDYHEAGWPQLILEATDGRGVDAAANAAGAAATALRAVADGGRLATITSDPPGPERGIEISSVYVRPDAAQLEFAVLELADGRLEFPPGESVPLDRAYAALERATSGRGGPLTLEL